MIWCNARLMSGALVDIATENGLIASVRPAGSVAPRGERTDVDGRIVVPGLWDAHVHFATHVALSSAIDVSNCESAAAVVSALRGRVDNELVFAFGFRSATWDVQPFAALLDEVSTGVPIVVASGDLHGAWLNSRALEVFGYPASHSGHLLEHEAFDIEQRVLADSVPPGAFARVAGAAAARGVVGIVDFEARWQVDDWLSLFGDGFDTLRVVTGVRDHHIERAVAQRYTTGQALHPLYQIGPMKVIGDGSLSSRTAWCHLPYDDDHECMGAPNVDPAALTDLLGYATRHGFACAVHAIGDRAVTATLDAFEATGARGSIEHAQLVADGDLSRFARLGVVASVQPTHLSDDWAVANIVWSERTHRMFPLRALHTAGATLRFGSDAPVSPLDPWHSIATAVHRCPGGKRWHPEQSITLDEALEASARSTIEAGQPADLVALDADPRTLDAAALARMPVAMTVVGAALTHDAR